MENPNEITEMKTMVSSLNSFIKKGYTEDYKVSSFGLKALKTKKYYQPSQVKVLDYHRFEGLTDPADEAILYAIETDDGLKGTLVDAYGPYSDTKVTAFMHKVDEISKSSPVNKKKINRMQIGKILIPAIVGTSAMTLFSYLVSKYKNRNFREPEVLGQLVKRLPISASKESAQIAGWGMHYAIGGLFVALYNELWKQKKLKPSVTSGALLGTASGLAGITAWKGMFEAHPNPPVKNLKRYFGHLMLAHVVFGIFSALTYKLTGADKNS